MRSIYILLVMILCLSATACGTSQAELDALATSIAADIFATQTAELPVATHTPVPPTAAPAPRATPTQTALPTHTAIPSPTPQPTFTLKPQPAWITEFAEPILSAIAGREPDYQDDFSSNKGRWKCPWEWKLKFVAGEMIVSECPFSRDMWYTDFVIEMDARYLSSKPEDRWRYHYRMGGTNYFFDFEQDGDVLVGYEQLGEPSLYIPLENVLRPGQMINHVLIIVKDQGVALFANDRPVFYGVLKPVWKNGNMLWSGGASVAYDNFKIWDISDVSLATLTAP
jgi:hypothetical protein